jgi:ribA/ribD-fused uncharacterized protein
MIKDIEYKIEKYEAKYQDSVDEAKKDTYLKKLNFYRSINISGGVLPIGSYQGAQNAHDVVENTLRRVPGYGSFVVDLGYNSFKIRLDSAFAPNFINDVNNVIRPSSVSGKPTQGNQRSTTIFLSKQDAQKLFQAMNIGFWGRANKENITDTLLREAQQGPQSGQQPQYIGVFPSSKAQVQQQQQQQWQQPQQQQQWQQPQQQPQQQQWQQPYASSGQQSVSSNVQQGRFPNSLKRQIQDFPYLLSSNFNSNLPPTNCHGLYPVNTICFYDKNSNFYEFTNFYSAPIRAQNGMFPTSEHYFQAQKFITTAPNVYAQIRNDTQGPRNIFDLAQKNQSLVDSSWWSPVPGTDLEKRDLVMYNALRLKFDQHSNLKNLLLSTKGYFLVEHTKNDKYWADNDDGTGKNMLGYLLVKLREDYLNGK